MKKRNMIIDIDFAVRFMHHVDVERAAAISEVQVTSIFSVKAV
jgi:hypothetical protein